MSSNQNRDLELKSNEEKSLINDTSFLGEYECSSLALDRRRKKKKRRRDDKDQNPSVDLAKEKKKRTHNDSKPSKKDKAQARSSKKGKSPSKYSKTDKSANAETAHDVEIDAGESVEDDMVDTEIPHQANDSVPKCDSLKWLKEDDVDVMASVFDFTNFTKNCLKKDKLTKAGLEGPTFKLMKGGHKNYIELEYNFKHCYLALTDQLDLVNPEGNRIPHDLRKPLPLQGPPGGNAKRRYSTSLTKPKAARYDLEGIKQMITPLWSSTKEIVVKRANQKKYVFKEADFPRLHLNDIKDMFLLYAQNKLHHLTGDQQDLDAKEPYTIFHKPRGVVYLNKDNKKYLMRADKLYKFRDGTLKKFHDKLDYILNNFELGYNRAMPKRAWTDKDHERTSLYWKRLRRHC
ncbi:hypothetical protein Tco_0773395 [Tanacetum coccineum]|uniref:Uncharacterized protein n=1 Tax=Tanacetum coccineum TaxID=301880 RepID=A0ABQ4ZKP2_9ASTR